MRELWLEILDLNVRADIRNQGRRRSPRFPLTADLSYLYVEKLKENRLTQPPVNMRETGVSVLKHSET